MIYMNTTAGVFCWTGGGRCLIIPVIPRFWLLPVDIPSKYYPLALALIFGLIRSSFLDLLCAAAVGYAFATVRISKIRGSVLRVGEGLRAWGCFGEFGYMFWGILYLILSACYKVIIWNFGVSHCRIAKKWVTGIKDNRLADSSSSSSVCAVTKNMREFSFSTDPVVFSRSTKDCVCRKEYVPSRWCFF